MSLPAFVPLALRQPVSLSAVSAEITFLDSSTLITEVALDTEFRVTKIASDPDPTVLVSPAITDVQKGMRIVATEAVPLFSTDNRAATGAVAIVGEASLDEVLRATQGTVSDLDGVPSPFEAGASYQWYRGGNRSFTPGATAPPIGTSPTYQVTPLDVGRYLRVRVIFVDALGNRETSLSPATDRVKEVVNTDATGQPAITGSDSTTEGVEFTYFGATLAAERGTIVDVVNGLSDDPFVATYQWQRSTNSAFDNPIPITDARSATYTLDGSEISAGEYIRVQVNFADASGFSEELVSAPLLVAETDLCLRTAQVVERITQQIGGSPPCLQVTVANLAGITELDLSNQQITSLQRGDLAGLTQVSRIAIGGGASADAAENNSLSTLPAGLFSGSGNLTGLTTLVIRNIGQLTTIEAGAFDSLPNLLILDLTGSGLSAFPEEIGALTSLTDLRLAGNALTAIPANALDPLTLLTDLDLSGNALTEIPDDALDPLTRLTDLDLSGNALTEIPDDALALLTRLTDLDLSGNALTEFPTAAILAASNSLTRLQLQGNQGAPYILPSDFIASSYQSASPKVGGYGELVAQIRFTFRFITVRDTTDSFSSSTIQGGRITDTNSENEGTSLTVSVEQTESRSLVIALRISSPNPANGITLNGASATPITLFETTVCARSQKVRVGIFTATQETPCALNTPAQLDGITSLNLSGASGGRISALRADDFVGLPNLTSLDLRSNRFSVFPSEAIAPLTRLTDLNLSGNTNTFAIPYTLGLRSSTSTQGTLRASLPIYVPSSLRSESAVIETINGSSSSSVALDTDFTVTLTDAAFSIAVSVLPAPGSSTVNGMFLRRSASLYLFNSDPTGVPTTSLSSPAQLRLTARTSSIADGDGLGIFSYQWHRGESAEFIPSTKTAIAGAIGADYRVANVDLGKYLRVVVGYTDLGNAPEMLISAARLIGDSPVCVRTPQVRQAIVAAVVEAHTCLDTTAAQLAAIESISALDSPALGSLSSGDFAGLSSLERLDIGLSEVAAANTQIANSALSTLPADLFQGLSSLNALAIRGFPSLSQLPAGLFRNLSQLNLLALSHNGLSSLPEGVFDGLSLLSSLDLGNNNLASLPPRLFWDLSTLDTLKLQSNSFECSASG